MLQTNPKTNDINELYNSYINLYPNISQQGFNVLNNVVNRFLKKNNADCLLTLLSNPVNLAELILSYNMVEQNIYYDKFAVQKIWAICAILKNNDIFDNDVRLYDLFKDYYFDGGEGHIANYMRYFIDGGYMNDFRQQIEIAGAWNND
jgi:hypothetical protein